MLKVSELQRDNLPDDGLRSLIKGKFYYRIAKNNNAGKNYENCFIADSFDGDSLKLYLPDELGEVVIDEDETFGMMVGGEFAYYDIDAEIDCIVEKSAQGFVCKSMNYLKLERNGDSQEFKF